MNVILLSFGKKISLYQCSSTMARFSFYLVILHFYSVLVTAKFFVQFQFFQF